MDGEIIKQNKKVRFGEMLHSLLYHQGDLRQSDARSEMPSQEVSRSKGEQRHKSEMLGKIKSAFSRLIVFLSGLVILLLCIVAALATLKDIETQKRMKLEESLTEKTQNYLIFREKIMEETLSRFQAQENLSQSETLLKKSRDLMQELLFGFKKEKIARLQLEQQLNDTKSILASIMSTKGETMEATKRDTSKESKRELGGASIRSGSIVNGKVLIVDKESGSALVNLGKKDSLSAGITLVVYRDNTLIARLLVVRVEERVSAARIVPSWRDISIIEEGDSVRSLE